MLSGAFDRANWELLKEARGPHTGRQNAIENPTGDEHGQQVLGKYTFQISPGYATSSMYGFEKCYPYTGVV